MMFATYPVPHVQPSAVAAPVVPPAYAVPWASCMLNELLALGAPDGGLLPGAELAAHALRLQLHQGGVRLRCWPMPTHTSPRPVLPAALAEILSLAGCDADLDRLRAWVSLAAATRWAAENQGRPMPPEAFFGASRCRGARSVWVELHLPATPVPLQMPALNLVTYDWRHVDANDVRSAREVALDVGALWRMLPAGPEHAAHLGEMAEVLLEILHQGQATPSKRRLLSWAAVELHRQAGLPGLPAGLLPQESFESALAVSEPAAPRPPSAGPAEIVPQTRPQADNVALHCPPAPLACAPPLLPPSGTFRLTYGGSLSAPPGARSPAARTTPPPAPNAKATSADHAPATGPVSVEALQLALEALAAPRAGASVGASFGLQHAQVANSLGSTPTLLGDTAPASPGSTSSGSSRDVWADARDQVGPGEAPGDVTPPVATAPGEASTSAEDRLRRMTEAPVDVAWDLLARAPRGVTQRVDETQALRFLEAPPAKALSAELLPTVALWLRRVASQPAQAQQLLLGHEVALAQWAQYRPLLRDLGRVLACWRDADRKLPAVAAWIEAAGDVEDGAPLLQTLSALKLDNPLYDAVLLHVAADVHRLTDAAVTEIVRLIGEKLGNKRPMGEATRQLIEQTLAYVVTCRPAACHALDFSRPYAWRVLSDCHREAGTLGLSLALSPALRPPTATAPKVSAAEMLQTVANSATPKLQIAAGAMLLCAYPRDVALAKRVARMLAEHDRALISASDEPGTTFEPRALRALVDICAAAAETWHGEACTVAKIIWYALERVAFAVPHYLAHGDYRAAASILHRAHGHPHLTLVSLQGLAKEGPAVLTEPLGRALDDVVVAETDRIANKAATLKAPTRLNELSFAPWGEARLAHARRELARRIVGNNAWKATAATRAMLDWADAGPELDVLFVEDGSASDALKSLYQRVVQRQRHGPWQRAERPLQKLTELLRGDGRRRGYFGRCLLAEAADDAASWADRALLLPLVHVALDATTAPSERRALAEELGSAFGLWRVELATASAPELGELADARRAARAAAAYALTPTLLASAAEAQAGPVRPIEANVRRARAHAALIHLLREPEHCAWRTPHLLEQVAASGALSAEQLQESARCALRDVAAEVWARGDRGQRSALVATTFDVAWSSCQFLPPNPTLALALLDGLLQVMDTSDDREASFQLLRPILHARRSADAAQDPRERQLELLRRHLWTRTLRANLPSPKPGEPVRQVTSAEIFSAGVTQKVCIGLHTWLSDAEPESLRQRYAALTRAWYPAADERLFEQTGYKSAVAAISFACTDPELRLHVQGALQHPPGVRPLLNVG